jgi:RNA polymerase subunit RPABC4/transcription elongation factor Spt4
MGTHTFVRSHLGRMEEAACPELNSCPSLVLAGNWSDLVAVLDADLAPQERRPP